jgi:hypothetical protein
MVLISALLSAASKSNRCSDCLTGELFVFLREKAKGSFPGRDFEAGLEECVDEWARCGSRHDEQHAYK